MRQRDQVGNRGAVLLILGVLWILTAIGISNQPIPDRGVDTKLLPYEHLPVWFRVALWGVPGLVAVISAVWRVWDPAAWALLIVPVAERALSFAWALGVHVFAGGYPTAWRGVLVYVGLGTLIYFCARGLDQPLPGTIRRYNEKAPQ